MVSCNINNKTTQAREFISLADSAVLIEKWTVVVNEPNLLKYRNEYRFYSNGQYEKYDLSSIPQHGAYYYQDETNSVFLLPAMQGEIFILCIQLIEEIQKPIDVQGKCYKFREYYDCKIDADRNFSVDENNMRETNIFDYVIREKIEE